MWTFLKWLTKNYRSFKIRFLPLGKTSLHLLCTFKISSHFLSSCLYKFKNITPNKGDVIRYFHRHKVSLLIWIALNTCLHFRSKDKNQHSMQRVTSETQYLHLAYLSEWTVSKGSRKHQAPLQRPKICINLQTTSRTCLNDL